MAVIQPIVMGIMLAGISSDDCITIAIYANPWLALLLVLPYTLEEHCSMTEVIQEAVHVSDCAQLRQLDLDIRQSETFCNT